MSRFKSSLYKRRFGSNFVIRKKRLLQTGKLYHFVSSRLLMVTANFTENKTANLIFKSS